MATAPHVTSRPRVAVVIPVCDEEKALQTLKAQLVELQRGLRSRVTLCFLFIDDGSKDRTVELLPDSVPAGCGYQIISHSCNMGIGAAFRTGFQAASKADIVCTIDADCSYRADQLIPMVDLLLAGKTDVVVASPYHPEGGAEGVPAWRLRLSRQCSLLYRLVCPLKLYTYTSMFRAYRGSFVRRANFRSSGFVSTVELLMSASSQGYRIHEMPVVLHRRVAGRSKMRILKTIWQHVRVMADCAFSKNHGYPSFCVQSQQEDPEQDEKDARWMRAARS